MLTLDIKWLSLLGLAVAALIAALSSLITYWRCRKNCVAWDATMYKLFDAAPFGVMLYSHEQGLLYSNLSSYSSQDHQTFLNNLTVAASTADARQMPPTTHSLADGKSVLAWVIAHGSGMATAYLLDLTPHKKADAEIRSFVGTLSHELRTPLTVMLSHLQIARSNEFAPETREASLALVHQEIRRTSQLVQEMTTLASLQVAAPTEMRLIDIVLIADDALSRVALVAEERQIGIELVTESAIPRIHGHADRLLQVFINLLDNALKYSRPGDNVTLRLSNRHTHVVCEIQDTGPGIPAEHLPHLTQRLYRVRRDEDGHGLGLAIVEEILRGHGSRLEVESAVDGERTGTRMGFQLHITTTP